jgi:hypothetical protein
MLHQSNAEVYGSQFCQGKYIRLSLAFPGLCLTLDKRGYFITAFTLIPDTAGLSIHAQPGLECNKQFRADNRPVTWYKNGIVRTAGPWALLLLRFNAFFAQNAQNERVMGRSENCIMSFMTCIHRHI